MIGERKLRKYYVIVRQTRADGTEVDHTYTEMAWNVVGASNEVRTQFRATFGQHVDDIAVRIIEVGEHPNGSRNSKVGE
jgi:DNA-binding ferritin-like protein